MLGHKPERAYDGDAAFDLFAAQEIEIKPNERASVGCQFAIALPERTAGLVLPRSGLALKYGVTVLNTPGLIDSGYRGEICVILANFGSEIFRVGVGDRIAQFLIIRLPSISFQSVADMPPTTRGIQGFGSSGIKS